MVRRSDRHNFIFIFAIAVIVVMILVAGITVLFDPFYVYHKPLPHLKAVLNDKEYQCTGTLKHLIMMR